MEKLTLQDIRPLSEYEPVRKELQTEIIKSKNTRRVQLGELVSLAFENRETIIFQIQEMMRAEHIYDEKKIQEEIDIYNPLVPEKGELSATLFIEMTEQAKIKETLDKLRGLDKKGVIYFKIGGTHTVPAIFEEGRSTDEKISSVHYVRFVFSKEQQTLFEKGEVPVELVVHHPNYQTTVRLTEETRRSLSSDFK